MCSWSCRLQCCKVIWKFFTVRVVPGLGHHRKLSNQKQLENWVWMHLPKWRWFLMLLLGGQVDRWFVRTISRIHMFWHLFSMHEAYVRIIFNIKFFFISFKPKINKNSFHKKCEFVLWNFECFRHRLHAILNKKIKTWKLLKQRKHSLFFNFSFKNFKN
jgi:hypothetical protein